MRVKFFEIFKKLVAFDKKAEIFVNGEDNAYPERVDRLINNSVTAKMASDLMTQYFVGEGFGEEIERLIINSQHTTTIKQFSENIAKELVDNRGVFIQVGYRIDDSANIVRTNPRVLPFDSCRLGKEDSGGYSGKIHVKNDWRDSKDEERIFDVYNTNEKVIIAQIENAGGIEKYKGQIYYYNADNRSHYPLARIDSVINDCDSEAQSSIYKNQLLRKGFFGNTLVVTRPLIDHSVSEFIVKDGEQIPNAEYQKLASEADQFVDQLEDFLGAGNSGGVMHASLDAAGDDLDKAIMIKNIEANIDPDMFQNVETSVRENILIAFNNLPVGLVKSNEGLFSDSAAAIQEMKRTYWENTMKDRQTFLMILNMFTNIVTETDLVPTPIVELAPSPTQTPE